MPPSLRDRIMARYQPFDPVPTGVETRMAHVPALRAAIFDVYGTMMLSAAGDIGAHAESTRAVMFAKAAEAAGFELGAKPGMLATAWRTAVKASHARSRAAGIAHPEIEVRDIWGELIRRELLRGDGSVEALALEFEMLSNPVTLEPGLVDVLALLRARGLALGIVSNAQFYTPVILETLLGQSLEEAGFHSAYCIWSYREREAKPTVRLYEKLAGVLQADGIRLEETLYIGNDMLNDIAPAAACGYMTGLYAGDQRSLRLREGRPECHGVVPTLVLAQLKDLVEVF